MILGRGGQTGRIEAGKPKKFDNGAVHSPLCSASGELADWKRSGGSLPEAGRIERNIEQF